MSAGAAIRAGDLVLARGEGADPLAALAAQLSALGAGLEDVVDVVSFHRDARDVPGFLEAARGAFGEVPPAWTPIPVVSLEDPRARAAVRAIAHTGSAPKEGVTPDTIAWWRSLPVSAGCRRGDLVCVSGQYGTDADGDVNTPGDDAGQARNALNRVAEIVTRLGGRPQDVVDVWSCHQDPRGMAPAARVWEEEFRGDGREAPPAWTALGAPALYGLGMLGQYRALAELGGGDRVGATPAGGPWAGAPGGGAAAGGPGGGAPGGGPGAGAPGGGAAGKAGGRLVAVTGAAAEAPGGGVESPGDAAGQARAALGHMERALRGMGASLADVVAIASFHLDLRDLDAVRAAAAERLPGDRPPVWSAAGMTGFWRPGQLHALHALAVR